MLSLNLAGKCIAVTGGFGTLGAAVGAALAAAGARVALIDRAPTPATASDAYAVSGVDLTSPDGAKDAIVQVVAHFGRLDAVVNVAGGFRWETVADGSVDTWDLLYQINLRTAVNTVRAALPHLTANPGSSIVNIGALASTKAALGMGAYAASKAGVSRLTEALAEELKDKSVTVNAILPSIIDTAPNRKDMPDADFSRWVKPGEIADLIVFLLSDRARAITGASIPIVGRV